MPPCSYLGHAAARTEVRQHLMTGLYPGRNRKSDFSFILKAFVDTLHCISLTFHSLHQDLLSQSHHQELPKYKNVEPQVGEGYLLKFHHFISI